MSNVYKLNNDAANVAIHAAVRYLTKALRAAEKKTGQSSSISAEFLIGEDEVRYRLTFERVKEDA